MSMRERLGHAVQTAVRSLGRNPGYAVPVIITLTLGIGLNSAIFAVADRVLRSPLPYPREAELVTVGVATVGAGGDANRKAPPKWEWTPDANFKAWKNARSLATISIVSGSDRRVRGNAGPEFVPGAQASPELLRVLSVRLEFGRWFGDNDKYDRVVVLSHALWRRQFPGNDSVLGKQLLIDGNPWTVIGVMSDNTALPTGAQFWVPFDGDWGQVVARLRPGISSVAAAAELTALSPTIANQRLRGGSGTVTILPLHEHLVGSTRPALRLLSAAAALLLLIACANITSLSLARALERRRDFAVRVALGANWTSLASIVFAENAVLAFIGATLGLFLAFGAAHVVRVLAPMEITEMRGAGVSGSSILFSLSLAVATAVVTSLGAVTTVTRRGADPVLRHGGAHGGRGRVFQQLRRILVVVQLSLALLLMAGAGLLIRSVIQLTRADHLGFSSHDVVVADLPLLGSRYEDAATRRIFARAFADRLMNLPGVMAVARGPLPLVGGRGDGFREGFNSIFSYSDTTLPVADYQTVWVKEIDPNYLNVFQIHLRSGRAFQSTDDEQGAPVVMLNAAAARLFFRDRNALNQVLAVPALMNDNRPAPRVVGIVNDVLQRDLAIQAYPEVYVPVAQGGNALDLTFAVRTASPTTTLLGLRDALRAIAPELATARLEPMDAVVDASLARFNFLRVLLCVFAGLGLALAVIGLYAVVSFLVTQRTLEIGVRMALGAQQYQIFGMVLGEAGVLVGAGSLIGIAATLALGRFLMSYLYDVKAYDVATLTAGTILLGAIALVATYAPARRAAALDCANTLRAD